MTARSVTDRSPRPTPSRLFGGDRLTSLLVDAVDVRVTQADWRVRAAEVTSHGRTPAAGRETIYTGADVDPATARFAIDGLPPGAVELRATSPVHGSFPGPTDW